MNKSTPETNAGETETTGHEWDGISEYNNPLPKWWLYTFYATIIWSIGYWIVMPSWPLISDHTKGVIGYSQRATVAKNIADAKAAQSVYLSRIAELQPAAIIQDPELFTFALAGGKAAFGDNCAPCHGSGAQGFVGYPNLNDDDWLWGGSLEAIETTIRYGIRSNHDETRSNEMPAFLTDEILSRAEVRQVTDYVVALSDPDRAAAEAAPRGAEIFAEQCAACHGEDGRGIAELGAPNLADPIWLFGGDPAAIYDTIATSRNAMMPAWEGRLSPATIKQLTIYVHSLGGGE